MLVSRHPGFQFYYRFKEHRWCENDFFQQAKLLYEFDKINTGILSMKKKIVVITDFRVPCKKNIVKSYLTVDRYP